MHIRWLTGYKKWIQVINTCFLRGRRGGVARKISKIPDPPFYPHQRQESTGWVTFPYSVTQSKTQRAVTSCKLRGRTFNLVKCFWHLMIFSYDRCKIWICKSTNAEWKSQTADWVNLHLFSGLKLSGSPWLIVHCLNPRQLNIMSSVFWREVTGWVQRPPQLCTNRLKQSRADSEPCAHSKEPSRMFCLTRAGSGRPLLTWLPLETETNSALIRSVPREGRDRVRTLHSGSRDKPCAGSVIPRYANRHGEVELRWLQLHQDA